MALTIIHQSFGLSASPLGLPILVTATAHPGQNVHTSSATYDDFVTLWAANNSANDVDLLTFITVNSSTSSSSSTPFSTVITIPAKSGKVVVEPGLRLSGGSTLVAYATAPNVLNLMGYVYQRQQTVS